MKLTKAILRPLRAAVRGGGVSISLFSRRRRRLTDGGSQGTSSSGKKRGGGRFENPEPSSPKVTCIGQVRVKSKRRAKQSLRSLSGGRPIGEASFRKPEQIITSHADRHRWVHLPICVCEALRAAFAAAAEFSCCCSSRRRECCLPTAGGGGNCGCWAVLGRWLVSVFFCGGGRRRKEIIEVVVGGGVTEVIVKEDHNQEEEEAINTTNENNEVLLMRCRSDEINEEEDQNDDVRNADFDGVRGFGEVKENEEEEDYKEEDSDESNMSSFEALLDQENTDQLPRDKNDDDDVISDKDTSSPFVEEEEEAKPEEEAAAMVVLPECLLLMMCEPKLSMEVSKETWVCSTDFVRRPERPQKAANAAANGGGCCHHGGGVKRRHLVVESKPPTTAKPNVPAPPSKKNDGLQPARSSCSLPAAAPSMAAVIEQKLGAGAAGYEPFALTRCKSEPMRTAAAKVMPESCLWKNGVVEPEPLGAGAGAAGVGF
ncbi:hypothetical protein ABFS82_08G188300 [Erythranthe guttata]|uniref:Uncharacterized protein n=1 Tax=Erythranthe guttata TaxID=4155 RepID=A0A022QGH4_ERYGU|nr:PREDICTED: uncharacterized protein LOC105970318 [Erythranthe guttata]EYU26353.1 hypothetical protein MIMGU_mgv1a025374mg [Erythranthe guttata]|eukprot:XP_012850580.1 PREDICTED: uncharacterized protein LOC105970318 [Erythranthe guttata]